MVMNTIIILIMSNVIKSFIGQLARPSQSALYAQANNDAIAQILHQLWVNNQMPSGPTSATQVVGVP